MTEPILTSNDGAGIPQARLKGKPKLFDCPACGGSIKLNAVGHSIRAICIHCGSLIDTSNEHLRLIQRMHEKLRPSVLQLGTYGTLQGKRWQVIGWIEKQDSASRVSWDEYLLFNPFYGFRFLVEAQGHWTLLEVVKSKVSAPAGQVHVQFSERTYDLYQEGRTEVTYVAGEFYWEVARGDASMVRDYIAPPFLLSVERSDGEINVAHGEYLEPSLVAATFGLGDRMPDADDVAPNQPSPYKASWRVIRNTAALFIFCAVMIQFGAISLADNETVLSKDISFSASEADKSVVIPGLKFSDQLADVVVETTGLLDNQWMEIDFELVNDKTEQRYKFRNAMEYYSGRDGLDYWSEGSNHSDAVLSTVSGGDYTLVADTDTGPPKATVAWSLRIRRDVALWANFWTVLLLGGLIPLYVLIRHHGFEKKRWSQSDYTPVVYRDSSDN
ncbi:MAG: DUF4178 domain-containing protein [Gammaproteobacteria bacterium]|nr:DUF4178 domain-containing protein [Gammaproteobacteria bacterium]